MFGTRRCLAIDLRGERMSVLHERLAWAAEPGLVTKVVSVSQLPGHTQLSLPAEKLEVTDKVPSDNPSPLPRFLPVCSPVCLDIRDPEPPSRGLYSGPRSAVPSLSFLGRYVLEFRFVSTWREGPYLCRRLMPQQAGPRPTSRRVWPPWVPEHPPVRGVASQ